MKKNISKFLKTYSLVILIIFYFLSRIINLTKLPIFNDEAIYLDWGWKSLHSGVGLFYSLYDAKSPFLIWIFGIFQSVIHSPLIMGRLVSVIAGFFTFAGVYKVAKNLGNERVARLASLLYIIIPLFVFFDRQALMESSLEAVGIWCFYLLLKFLKTKKNKYSVYLGLVLGVGIFIKLSTLIFLVSIITILIYKKYFKSVIITIFSSIIIISPLFLQKIFWNSLGSNNRFMLSIQEVIKLPLIFWLKNFLDLINVSFFHLTPFIFILTITGIYFLYKNKNNLLSLYFLINLGLVVFFSKIINPRYLVPFLVPVTIFCSYTILNYKEKFLIFLIAIIPAGILAGLLIFLPIKYFNILSEATTYSQKDDYVTNWTSGYGIPETINYLNQRTKMGKIIIGVRVDAGNPESAMFTYFNGSKNTNLVYLDPKELDQDTLKLNCLRSPVPIYFVTRDGNLDGFDKLFQEEVRFYKPYGQHFISIDSLKKCN